MTTEHASCDLIVVGSGAGGLSAAVTAATLGLDVVVVEKAKVFGGTTAWSGGWMWVPRNPLAVAAGIEEDDEGPRTYLRHLLGAQYDGERIEAYLRYAPEMVKWFRAHTCLDFIDGNAIPDFHGRSPGARTGGRSVCAAPFDASALGPLIDRLRPPHPLMTVFGMSVGADLKHFMRVGRSWTSTRHVAGRVWRHGNEHLRHGDSLLRMGGNALAAALLASAQQRGVRLLTEHTAVEITRGTDGGVDGLRVESPQGRRWWHTRRGVVLASGGFPHDAWRQHRLFPAVPHWSAAPRSNTGDGLRMGERAGGGVKRDLAHPAAWAPCSRVPMPDGTEMNFPHLVDRGKPGVIAVDVRGRRFVDEAGDYHSFMRALLRRCEGEAVQAWLVCDHRFIRRWGLGAARPRPFPLRRWLSCGYLLRAETPEALARAAGIDAIGFEATLSGYNRAAREGRDPEYDRGGTPYDRAQGDANHDGPNPCVAPIECGPYYAVRVVPGSLGTFAGLAVDAHGRVLDAGSNPIHGLYAAGNDMASVMGGHYPSGGITLGPAMTFGWMLAHHAAGQPLTLPMPMPLAA